MPNPTPPPSSTNDPQKSAERRAEHQAADAKAEAGKQLDDAKAAAARGKHAAQDAKRAATDALHDAEGKAKQLAADAKSQATAAVKDVKSRVLSQVHDTTAKAKEKAATEVGTFGTAIRKAAEELDKNDEPAARWAFSAADRLDETSDYLWNRDTDELLRSAEGFARRHPEVVLGGMFLAGMGLARFFKATREPAPVRGGYDARSYAGGRYPDRAGRIGYRPLSDSGPRLSGPSRLGPAATGPQPGTTRPMGRSVTANDPARTAGGTGGSAGGAVTVGEETVTVVPAK